jgi:hypothetical protein
MQIPSYVVWWSPRIPDKRSGQGQANDDNEQRPRSQKSASDVALMDVSVMTSCQ